MIWRLPKPESEQELMALARVGSAPELEHFRRYLKRALAQKDGESRELDGPGLYRNQGVALAIYGLLDLMESAREGDNPASRKPRPWQIP